MEEIKPDKSKEELFKDNPDSFIHANDIMVGVIKGEEGIGIIINPHMKRGEATKALGELQIALTKTIIHMDAIIAQQNNKIIKPNGGIVNFVNRLKR